MSNRSFRRREERRRRKQQKSAHSLITPTRAKACLMALHNIEESPFWQVPLRLFEERSLEDICETSFGGLVRDGQLMNDTTLVTLKLFADALREKVPGIVDITHDYLGRAKIPVDEFIGRSTAGLFDAERDAHFFTHCLRMYAAMFDGDFVSRHPEAFLHTPFGRLLDKR